MSTANDLDLLEIEMDTLWGRDVYGRFEREPSMALGIAVDGQAVRLSKDLPDEIAQLLVDCAAAERLRPNTADPPPSLNAGREILEQLGVVEVSGGPTYLVELGPLQASDCVTLSSDQPCPEELYSYRPARWWQADEWRDLLDGRLGPWAMTIESARVTAICHTPRASAHGAEAGVWTHPDFRGRGLAATVTTAWSTQVGLPKHLFYSTSVDNASSQRVADKLSLRPLGWIYSCGFAGRHHDRGP